jgi:hypothetical protein
LLPQELLSGRGNGVGTPPVVGLKRMDPAAFFQACDGSVESAGAEAHSGKALYVFDHGVAVFFASGEAGKDK